jgi:hypothetical protein
MYRQKEVSRVLARSGARFIAQEEWEQVAGGIITNNCTLVQGTKCTLDGDCPVPIRCT